jgi:DNA polymerase III alpha subunit
MAAVLANWGGYYSQRVYITEARRLGLTIRPPLVNYARQEFSVRFIDGNEVLVMGLNQVRDLTRHTQTRILELRPFHSLTDLLIRVDPRPIEAENLVRSGALEDLGNIPALLNQLQSGKWQKGQLPLFAARDESTEDWTLAQKVASQETILGASIAAHPLELYASQISEYQAATTIEAAENIGQRVRIAGMRQIWRRSSTSRGEYIYFMSLEDLQGMIRVVINGDTYRRYRAELSGRGPYVLEGVVQLDPSGGEPFIRLERIWKVHADQ